MTQPTRKEQSVWADHEAAWRQLLVACASGDQTALASLYDQSASLVYGIAVKMLGDLSDAEEVTIDVYHQVWRAAKSYDSSRGSVTSWLVTMARSRAIDRLRSRTNRSRTEQLAGTRSADLPSIAAGPDETTLAEQRRKRILSAMAVLSPEQREAIELAFFSGLTHAELAERFKQPLGTVKTRIRLGMMKLREQLGELAI